MPAFANEVFSIIMQIASFDYLDVGAQFDKVFETADSEALGVNFEALGFETTYFIHNMGSMLLPILFIPFFMAIGFMFQSCGRFSPSCGKIGDKIIVSLRWNGTI